jgi:hypothetical protein
MQFQDRRPIRPQPFSYSDAHMMTQNAALFSKVQVGDVFYVREMDAAIEDVNSAAEPFQVQSGFQLANERHPINEVKMPVANSHAARTVTHPP